MTDHAHSHGHAHDAVGTRPLKIALAATAALALLEAAGGFVAQSLALLSDAAHVTMDVVALGIALAASLQALRPANERQTYGFARMEILAALANGALLVAITLLIVVEAFRRFAAPESPQGSLMAGIALIGLVVNVGIGLMLVRTAQHTLNLKSALMHVGGDALGAIAVVIGGVLIALTGAVWIDPALSLVVSAIIVFGVSVIFRDATHVLLESAPSHAKLPLVREQIRACPGVVAVHDLHVWTLGSGSHALSAHIVLDDRRISEATAVLNRINEMLRHEFDIAHVTLQFECESCDDDDRIVCTQTAQPREPLSTSGT